MLYWLGKSHLTSYTMAEVSNMTEKPANCVLWSWVILLVMVAIPHTAALAVVATYLPHPWRWPLWVLWIGGLAVIGWVYLPLRRKRLRFSLSEQGIETTSGVVFTTTRCIRYDAVRQVTLLQGPIERRCHTAFLLVSGTGGYLLVEGIGLKTAEDWCRRLCPP